MIVQSFYIAKEQLKDIECIVPSGKDYNLYLGINQYYTLSKTGKKLYLCRDDNGLLFIDATFIVSKTVFLLRNKEENYEDN